MKKDNGLSPSNDLSTEYFGSRVHEALTERVSRLEDAVILTNRLENIEAMLLKQGNSSDAKSSPNSEISADVLRWPIIAVALVIIGFQFGQRFAGF